LITELPDRPPHATQEYADEQAPPAAGGISENAPPATGDPIATHGSPEIGSSPDVESPPEVESGEQKGVHDCNEDSMTQGNARRKTIAIIG
jgi:hypothetical protein